MTIVQHRPIAVIKIGGSVLTGAAAYDRAASYIARRIADEPGTRLVAVVSAEHGLTDALLDTARAIGAPPDPTVLDLLWSTGELRSVALLAFRLQALGILATGVNVHQTGLLEPDDGGAPGRTLCRPSRLLELLGTHDVVVAPGFLARGSGDSIVSLGRGGSDLTAVVLAVGLNALRCELVKDVPGTSRPIPTATSTRAICRHSTTRRRSPWPPRLRAGATGCHRGRRTPRAAHRGEVDGRRIQDRDRRSRPTRAPRQHPGVRQVYYPGLPAHPGHVVARRQMTGYGGTVSFELDGSVDDVVAFVSSRRFFALGESLGGVKALVCHPARMTHASIPASERREARAVGHAGAAVARVRASQGPGGRPARGSGGASRQPHQRAGRARRLTQPIGRAARASAMIGGRRALDASRRLSIPCFSRPSPSHA